MWDVQEDGGISSTLPPTMVPVSAHCHHLSFKLYEGSVKHTHPSSIVFWSSCCQWKAEHMRHCFLWYRIEGFSYLASGMDHSPLYNLITNQKQKFTFLPLQEIWPTWKCWILINGESLWAQSNTLNPWQNFYFVIGLGREITVIGVTKVN